MNQSKLVAKTYSQYKQRKSMQPVPSAPGKTYKPYKARENIQPDQTAGNGMQPAQSVGKHATSTKRGKTYDQYKVRENIQKVPSAGLSTQHKQ